MAALLILHLDFVSHVDKTPPCLVYTCDFFDANYLIVVRLCQPRHSFFTIFNHEKSSLNLGSCFFSLEGLEGLEGAEGLEGLEGLDGSDGLEGSEDLEG